MGHHLYMEVYHIYKCWILHCHLGDRRAEVLAIFDQEVISDEVQRSNEVTTWEGPGPSNSGPGWGPQSIAASVEL